MAKSCYVQAMELARGGQYDEARARIKEGEECFVMGHTAHTRLLQKEAAEGDLPFVLLVMHAEDQLMSAETIKVMAEEFINVYESK